MTSRNICLIFVLVMQLISTSFATTYENCGTRPGLLERLISDAEKIRTKCIDDIYEANKKKVQKELDELHQANLLLSDEIKKSAIKVNYNIVICSPRKGEPARSPELISRCNELVNAKNAIISRIEEITEWESKRPVISPTKATPEHIVPPCPSKENLKKIQSVRMFNRKLYKTWERCVTLDPESYLEMK